MQKAIDKREVHQAVIKARSQLLLKAPFYGNLLMRLGFAFAPCGTAGTDMKKIYWDPNFVSMLNTEEIEFILLHEVLHCVLHHPKRGKGRIQSIYNVAADIVVNSTILQSLQLETFQICGEPVMCLTPEGRPGYLFTAEEVYEQLLKQYQNSLENAETLNRELKKLGDPIDIHEVWEDAEQDPLVELEWEQYVKEAVKKTGTQEFSRSLRQLLEKEDHQNQIPWKKLLHAFVQEALDQYDYSFQPPDRRFADSPWLLPGYYEIEGEKLERIWFFVDASGSVSDEMFAAVYSELKSCLESFVSVQGRISFFDTAITETKEFDSIEDLDGLQMDGNGGTNYQCIFEELKTCRREDFPQVLVILTDGYASFPKEKEAQGVPVLWLIADNPRNAPWGKTVHFEIE